MRGIISSRKLLSAITDWINPVYEIPEAHSIGMIILEKLFGLTYQNIKSTEEISITEENSDQLNYVIHRLLKHEPIQYIFGEAYFYDRWLMVDKNVLIPRSETEELCKLIIDQNKDTGLRILDIGTGSGCIAIILKIHLDKPIVYAWDNSIKAVELAISNARRFGLDINFEVADIFKPREQAKKFDIIVSNPPYVRISETRDMRRNVLDYEPRNAIFVEDTEPLLFYEKILMNKSELLSGSGKIYFEINSSSGFEMGALLDKYHLKNIKILKDLNGKDRFATAEN